MKKLSYFLISISFLFGQDKWTISAELMESDVVNNVRIKRLNNNVQFIKENKILLTDNAIQYVKDDIIYLNGNTIMISESDTLTCDSMVYWSKIDSIYAYGNIRLVHETGRGILGDKMEVLYTNSTLRKVRVINNAYAFNNLNVQIEKNGPYLFFNDEMKSKEMIAYYEKENISKIELLNMATTSYHVIDDSLLSGKNVATGDTIIIDFNDGNISRIQVIGGALGEFKPEINNTKIDTTIFYGGNYIDYYIDQKLTYLSQDAFVEYQDTKLNSGKIVANWETNILDAFELNDEFPIIRTKGESPMTGNTMIFDLIAKHGRIKKGKISYNNGNYHGKEVYRDEPNIFHIKESKLTSCDLDNPHFYLRSKYMKLLPKDKFVAKPISLHIFDIPIIGLPMGVFPNKAGSRHSGWIMPSFDSFKSKGTGFTGLGYYWAPNNYIDQKLLINFFDKEGININSHTRYKKRNGIKKYNFEYVGNIKGNFRKLINSNEIMDLISSSTTEKIAIDWIHQQKFDPTQTININYKYKSDKKAYLDDQENDFSNRLDQTLYNNITYYKRWQSSSIHIGYKDERYLSIENNPNIGDNTYRYVMGPNLTFSINPFNIFGSGDKWYNSITSNYSMGTDRKNGWKKYFINKDLSNNLSNTTLTKKPSFYHKSNINLPIKNLFGWLTINPRISLTEYWIGTYKEEIISADTSLVVEKKGFKRRLTWNSSLSANTKIYGLFPISIGRLNAIRHVITPTLSFNYTPDFSNSRFGYFQQNTLSGNPVDYFQDYSKTPKNKKSSYTLKINNLIQAKIEDDNREYKKANVLNISSSVSYNPFSDEKKISYLNSNIGINNLSGNRLVSIFMRHDFYKLSEDNLINIFKKELPRLASISIKTDLKINIFGSSNEANNSIINNDSIVDIEDEIYSNETNLKTNNENNTIWNSKLQFKYNSNWDENNDEWDYNFTLTTVNSINLSKNWKLTYMADFNIKKIEMTHHSFRFYRPLHCWEFSFNYWPRGRSSGFRLQINVKNPDFKDIKLTSKDGRRGFSGF